MLRNVVIATLLLAGPLSAQVPAHPAPPAPPPAPVPTPLPSPAPIAAPEPFDVWTPLVATDVPEWASDMSTWSDLADLPDINLDLPSLDNVDWPLSVDVPAMSFDLWTSGESANVPAPWAPQDPADSLYRAAREQLNKGDYRKAADLFKSLPEKFPRSVYADDAKYWQAFSLYRIGGTPELRQALDVLLTLEASTPGAAADSRTARVATRDSLQQVMRQMADAQRTADQTARIAQRTVSPAVTNAETLDALARASSDLQSRLATFSMRTGRVDAAGLAARIANVLAQRGYADDPAVKQALAAAGNECDPDEQSVRVEALSALMQSAPTSGRSMAVKILAKRDKCSEPLRRDAVMLLGNSRDSSVASVLIPVAKSDPSESVRSTAMQWLVRSNSDAALSALIDLASSDTSTAIRRNAASALAQSSDPKAKAEVRRLLDDAATDATVRQAALSGFNPSTLTADDATWLEGLYSRTTDQGIKRRIVSILGYTGGQNNTQWLTTLMRNTDEPLEMRAYALQSVGRGMDVAALSQLYDASSERPIRQEVVELLAQRNDSAAVGKLIDIARTGTDPTMRREAISALARSKDPRATKALLDLIDR
jgi:HEAT repeat protein